MMADLTSSFTSAPGAGVVPSACTTTPRTLPAPRSVTLACASWPRSLKVTNPGFERFRVCPGVRETATTA